MYLSLYTWRPVSRSHTSSLGRDTPPAKREDIYLKKNVSISISISISYLHLSFSLCIYGAPSRGATPPP